jgi:hypothetical protein
LVQNPNTLRRSPDKGVSLYNVTLPANVTNAFISCLQIYEWNGYVYAIMQDSTDSAYKVYRAAITTGLTALTWSAPLLTLTTGATTIGYAISGTSTALLVGEYGDPLVASVKTPNIWRTTDGTTFSVVKTFGPTYRHVHCVKADPYNDGTVWASVGDNVDNCYSVSTDHGATWTDLPVAQAWQATEITFGPDWVYASPDSVSQASLFVFDRTTRTPAVGASTNHRALSVRDMGTYTTGSSTLGSAAFTDATGPFVPADKGRKIYGPGIPDGTTVLTYNSAASITMSATATATAATTAYTIERFERPAATCYVGAVDPSTGIYYGAANTDAVNNSTSFGRRILFCVPYVGGPCIHLADLNVGGPSLLVGQGSVWFGTMYRPTLTSGYSA